MRNLIPPGLTNEYIYENGIQFEIKLVVIEALFFYCIWRCHLDTCIWEFYYEYDWSSARIILIVQKTKNGLSGK